MAKSIHRVSVEIRRIEALPGNVRLIELADHDDWELPPFTSGAHVDVHLPSGRIRQYSLCGSPDEPTRYLIAVARDAAGRGGSAEVHDALAPGMPLLLSLPRNHFPLISEGRVVLVAGGIGITPFLSMLPELLRTGRNFELHVCTPSAQHDGFSRFLGDVPADRLKVHYSDDGSRLDLSGLIDGLGPEDHIYVCGPGRMISEAREFEDRLGERLHIELFGAGETGQQAAYVVELANSGQIVPVGAGETMLEALRAAGVEVPSSCEGGVCLDCKTRYLEGTPVHRDLVLPAHERGTHLTPCVSGCAGDRIVLDLPQSN
ncbi:PDR/VanB family oxidoreductase [Seohaeicola nanhaiensis]|uniref:PDR/VanB family oxidoreductase n=1 Tax=Seohaeicola nanhaiensis TaxID=1387282 RepID=A0ABV9KFJ7_9RHOB